jgi:hypothetical protein
MPSGYTAAIKDGIDFKTFALQCARAFGALVMMRDDPADAPIPERFEPSDYHVRAIAEAQQRLNELDGMPVDEAGREAQAQYVKEVQSRRDRIAENDALRVKYQAMLKQVDAWEVPTPDHEGLKKFMREQIESSIEFDCNNDYYLRTMPVLKTPLEWRSEQVEKARRDISYHSKENAEEIGRTATRNDWVKALRESLK